MISDILYNYENTFFLKTTRIGQFLVSTRRIISWKDPHEAYPGPISTLTVTHHIVRNARSFRIQRLLQITNTPNELIDSRHKEIVLELLLTGDFTPDGQ